MGLPVTVDEFFRTASTSLFSPTTSLLSCSMRLLKPEMTSFKAEICEACFSCSCSLFRLSLCSKSMREVSCCCCCFNTLMTSPSKSVSLVSVSSSVSRRSGVKASFGGGKKSVFRVDDGSSLAEITESSNISS